MNRIRIYVVHRAVAACHYCSTLSLASQEACGDSEGGSCRLFAESQIQSELGVTGTAARNVAKARELLSESSEWRNARRWSACPADGISCRAKYSRSAESWRGHFNVGRD